MAARQAFSAISAHSSTISRALSGNSDRHARIAVAASGTTGAGCALAAERSRNGKSNHTHAPVLSLVVSRSSIADAAV